MPGAETFDIMTAPLKRSREDAGVVLRGGLEPSQDTRLRSRSERPPRCPGAAQVAVGRAACPAVDSVSLFPDTGPPRPPRARSTRRVCSAPRGNVLFINHVTCSFLRTWCLSVSARPRLT